MSRSSTRAIDKRQELVDMMGMKSELATKKLVQTRLVQLYKIKEVLFEMAYAEIANGRYLGLDTKVELYPGKLVDKITAEDLKNLSVAFLHLLELAHSFTDASKSYLNIRSSVHQPRAIIDAAVEFLRAAGFGDYVKQVTVDTAQDEVQVNVLSQALYRRLVFQHLRMTGNTHVYIDLKAAKRGVLQIVPEATGDRLADGYRQAKERGEKVDEEVRRVVLVRVTGSLLEEYFSDIIDQILSQGKHNRDGVNMLKLTTGSLVSAQGTDGNLYMGIQSVASIVAATMPNSSVKAKDLPPDASAVEIFNANVPGRRELNRLFLTERQLYNILVHNKLATSETGEVLFPDKKATISAIRGMVKRLSLTASQQRLLDEIIGMADMEETTKMYYDAWLTLAKEAKKAQEREKYHTTVARPTKKAEMAARVRDKIREEQSR